jgi:hypothetical protein
VYARQPVRHRGARAVAQQPGRLPRAAWLAAVLGRLHAQPRPQARQPRCAQRPRSRLLRPVTPGLGSTAVNLRSPPIWRCHQVLQRPPRVTHRQCEGGGVRRGWGGDEGHLHAFSQRHALEEGSVGRDGYLVLGSTGLPSRGRARGRHALHIAVGSRHALAAGPLPSSVTAKHHDAAREQGNDHHWHQPCSVFPRGVYPIHSLSLRQIVLIRPAVIIVRALPTRRPRGQPAAPMRATGATSHLNLTAGRQPAMRLPPSI